MVKTWEMWVRMQKHYGSRYTIKFEILILAHGQNVGYVGSNAKILWCAIRLKNLSCAHGAQCGL